MRKDTRRTPKATEIRKIAGPEVFERGEAYRKTGAVSDLVLRGDTISAAVAGSEDAPYRVTARLESGRVTAWDCTCPYEWGGACKHVVATLLVLADDPEAAATRPTLAALLEPLNCDDLLDLILTRAEADPDLTGWIEAERAVALRPHRTTPVEAAPIAARARALLAAPGRRRDYWDGYHSHGDAEALRTLAGKAVPHLEAGDGRSALRILEAVAEPLVEDWLRDGYESDEDFYPLFRDLGHMMAEAALLADLAPAARDTLSATLEEWSADLYEAGVEESFGLAGRALETGWDDPALAAILAGGVGPWPQEAAEDLDEIELTGIRLRVLAARGQTDAYLNLARAAGAQASVATMLVRLDRGDEAVAHGRAAFTLPDEALALARALMEAERSEDAFRTAEAGLTLGREAEEADAPWRPGTSVAPLALWLREAAASAGKRDLAVTAARAAFSHSLSRADFQAARDVAGAGWERVRTDLLTRLMAADHAGDRTEILLDEGMIEEAVASVGEARDHDTTDAVLLRLMEAAQARHSDWVIRLAERKAGAIMDGGAAGRYAEAAAWLARAAQAYDAAGRIDDWGTRIEGLIETHKRKYKLRPLLEALRYDA